VVRICVVVWEWDQWILGGWVCVCRSMVVFGVGRYMCVGGGRLCVAGVYVKVN